MDDIEIIIENEYPFNELDETNLFTHQCSKCDAVYPITCEEEPLHCIKCNTALFPVLPEENTGLVKKINSCYEYIVKQTDRYDPEKYVNHQRIAFFAYNSGCIGHFIATRLLNDEPKLTHNQEKYIPLSFVTEFAAETTILSIFVGPLAPLLCFTKIIGTNLFGYCIGKLANKYVKKQLPEK